MASTDVEKQKLDIPPLFGSCRLTLVLISFGIVFLLFLMRFNLSMGIVCLTKNGNEIRDFFGQLQVWDKTLQGYILGAFFYGYICTQVLGGYVSDRFGGKVGVMVGIGIASLSCLLIPIAVRLNPWLVFGIRIIQGMVSGFAIPSIYRLFSVWTGPSERATQLGIVFSAVALGTVVNYPFASLMCQSSDQGWSLIFYVPGSLGLLLTIAFYFLVFNAPREHPRISPGELMYLQNTCQNTSISTKDQRPVPWKNLLTSLPLHALWISHLAWTWSFYLTAINLPLFAQDVYDMDVLQIGLLSSLPYMGMLIFSFSGKLFDYLRVKNLISLTNLRKIFNSVGFLVAAISTLSLRFLEPEDYLGAICLLIVTMSSLQVIQNGGFFFSHTDVFGPYSGLAFGITNTIAQIPGFVTSMLVAYMTPHGTRDEWLEVYDIAGLICCFGGLVYAFFGTSELQSWARVPSQKHKLSTTEN